MPTTKDGRPYVRFTVELHPDADARFRAFTEALGRNRADVVRLAIEEYIMLNPGWKVGAGQE